LSGRALKPDAIDFQEKPFIGIDYNAGIGIDYNTGSSCRFNKVLELQLMLGDYI
jgi:hypothetical protein